MKAFTGTALLALLVLGGCSGEGNGGNTQGAAGGSTAPTAAVPAPNGGDWTQTVSQTPEGGFMMGNPNAPVKVVEFGSLTCHVCKEFSENGEAQLIENYVKPGRVSFEFRNYVRDAADLGAALLSRCGGTGPFFKLTDQLYASQDEWLGRLQNIDPATQQRLQSLPPEQQVSALAEQAGLVDFVRMRGVPAEKARACLANQQELQRIVEMNTKANEQYQIQGTPTFLINGEVAPQATSWETLEPQIKTALGG